MPRSLHPDMTVLGLVGPSGSGKTTLLRLMLPLFKAHGLSVSTVKHSHHGVDMDKPGKDTWLHREAGAREVLLSGPDRFVLQREYHGTGEPPLADLLSRMEPVDLVLIEGFRPFPQPKFLVHRPTSGRPMPDPHSLENLLAVVSDAPLPDLPVPLLDINDPAAVVAFALAHPMLALSPGATPRHEDATP